MSEEVKNETATATCCEGGGELARAQEETFVKPHFTSRRVEDDVWEVGVVVPGVKKENVTVSLEDDELEVVARRDDHVPENWRPLQENSARPSYRLRLEVAVDIDGERISAKLEDGILTLRLPLDEAVKPRTISVE